MQQVLVAYKLVVTEVCDVEAVINFELLFCSQLSGFRRASLLSHTLTSRFGVM